MSEIATGKLVIWMRLQAKRITPDGNRIFKWRGLPQEGEGK
jgi:hypothetical protein